MVIATVIATVVRTTASEPAPGLSPTLVSQDATQAAPPPDPAPPATPPDGPENGVQAANAHGWELIGGDEFNGGLSDKWNRYDGPGHADAGRRSPAAVGVRGDALVISGDATGTTGGMAWSESRRYGKWEMRAKFPAGDRQYHPVLLLWPTEVEWPLGGEIDFAETTSASKDVSFFLHHGPDNAKESARKKIDITRWHNYAVEWTPQGITGYIDGKRWFASTDPDTLPPGPMHPAIQLDYVPGDGSPKPTEMFVDWMRIYA
ncbi:glycoside hydrolase family 16 protein [Pseudonocardia bannensis]|uniref:Glycoside hydrolase family 16 protein n=1 Tax=Pseudonocardia bannensis TaxID=630973 RepID=A0A848DBF7_9PSEU|nr:glycoside hydrolase family 16 protein [Pseudonocardia bannensis]NMH90100.1 glycoside hydrolase family 16 protein [Pseudonocardia bannensis]